MKQLGSYYSNKKHKCAVTHLECHVLLLDNYTLLKQY